MNRKHLQNIFHVSVNENMMEIRKSNQWWNNEKCRCECKKIHVCEKDYVWNTATCNSEVGNI